MEEFGVVFHVNCLEIVPLHVSIAPSRVESDSGRGRGRQLGDPKECCVHAVESGS